MYVCMYVHFNESIEMRYYLSLWEVELCSYDNPLGWALWTDDLLLIISQVLSTKEDESR